MKGSKTVAFNALMTLVGLVGAQVDPETATRVIEAFALIWGVGNIILRAVTNTPIFKRF